MFLNYVKSSNVLEILPDKFTSVSETLVGHAAFLLSHLAENETVSGLYTRVKSIRPEMRFETIAMALTFLYAAGIVSYEDGILKVERK